MPCSVRKRGPLKRILTRHCSHYAMLGQVPQGTMEEVGRFLDVLIVRGLVVRSLDLRCLIVKGLDVRCR